MSNSPTRKQYFQSLRVIDRKENFLVAKANIEIRIRQQNCLKNIGAATLECTLLYILTYGVEPIVDIGSCEEQVYSYVDLSDRQEWMDERRARQVVSD